MGLQICDLPYVSEGVIQFASKAFSQGSRARMWHMNARSRSPHRECTGSLDLHPGSKVRLHHLRKAKHLNGQCGVIESFLQGSGRWRVQLELEHKVVELKSEKIRKIGVVLGQSLCPGFLVVVRELDNAPALNGMKGVLERFIGPSECWRVSLNNGQVHDIKAANLSSPIAGCCWCGDIVEIDGFSDCTRDSYLISESAAMQCTGGRKQEDCKHLVSGQTQAFPQATGYKLVRHEQGWRLQTK